MPLLAFMNIGGQELILILLIILVLFGARKLPELARGMGQAIKEFQKAKDEFSNELHSADKTELAQNTPEVRTPSATVSRAEAAPAGSQTQPDPNQSIPPGKEADQV